MDNEQVETTETPLSLADILTILQEIKSLLTPIQETSEPETSEPETTDSPEPETSEPETSDSSEPETTDSSEPETKTEEKKEQTLSDDFLQLEKNLSKY